MPREPLNAMNRLGVEYIFSKLSAALFQEYLSSDASFFGFLYDDKTESTISSLLSLSQNIYNYY
jgi:hypothetical protein